jgi:hypothetical protein
MARLERSSPGLHMWFRRQGHSRRRRCGCSSRCSFRRRVSKKGPLGQPSAGLALGLRLEPHHRLRRVKHRLNGFLPPIPLRRIRRNTVGEKGWLNLAQNVGEPRFLEFLPVRVKETTHRFQRLGFRKRPLVAFGHERGSSRTPSRLPGSGVITEQCRSRRRASHRRYRAVVRGSFANARPAESCVAR